MKAGWMCSFLLMLTLCAVLGCSMRSFGKATPPSSLVWKKNGYSEQMVVEDLKKCQIQVGGYASGLDNMNKRHQCMLDNGYSFDDDVSGFARVCDSPIFKDSVGCRSMRGEPYR